VVFRPRIAALQAKSSTTLSLQDIDDILLELSYMPRDIDAIVLADYLLDRRIDLTAEMAVA
jgi:hypothetical protein